MIAALLVLLPLAQEPVARARSLLEEGRLEEAQAALDAIEGTIRESPAFLLLQGRVALGMGDAQAARGGALAGLHYEDASRALRTLLEKEPNRLDAAHLLFRARLALGDGDGAADALARDPGGLDPRLVVERLEPEAALAALQSAALAFEASEPTNPDADAAIWWWIGWLRFARGEWSGAREAYERSFAKNPSFSNALHYAGRAAFAEGDFAAAGRCFLALYRSSPIAFGSVARAEEPDLSSFHEILFFLADRAFRERRLGNAADLFGAIATFAEEDPVVLNNRAFLCRQTGRYEEAYEAYSRAVRLRRDDPRLWNDTALILHYNLRRSPDLARSMYERAIECADVHLADASLPLAERTEALAAKKDAEENLRRLLAGRIGPEPPR